MQAEKHLSDMVVAKALSARMDRPAGVIKFAQRKAPAELLNGWARNIGRAAGNCGEEHPEHPEGVHGSQGRHWRGLNPKEHTKQSL